MANKPLAIPNVVPGCIVRVLDFSDENALPTWRKIAECVYAPRPINDVLKAHNLESAQVVWLCGKETWYRGDQLATQTPSRPAESARAVCAHSGCTLPTSGKSKYCKEHKKIAREHWKKMIADKANKA